MYYCKYSVYVCMYVLYWAGVFMSMCVCHMVACRACNWAKDGPESEKESLTQRIIKKEEARECNERGKMNLYYCAHDYGTTLHCKLFQLPTKSGESGRCYPQISGC